MYHYKARIYSPTLGRFLQTDPVGYQDQFNLYAYVGNDPINSTDPSGTVRCNTKKHAQCGDVHRAAGVAREAALQASSDLRGIAGAIRDGTELAAGQQRILGAFERKFGSGSGTAAALTAAAAHFDRVATNIGVEGAGFRVRFRSDAYMGNALASLQLNGSEINIGSRFFGTNMGPVQAFVVLHEAGHSTGLEDTIMPANAPDDYGHFSLGHMRGYGVKAIDWLAENARGQAAINNDNYNCFVMPICGGL